MDSDSYFQLVRSRLLDEGYKVLTGMKVANYDLDLLSYKGSWELTKVGKITRFVLGTKMPSPTIESIVEYSKSATRYVLENWKKDRSTGFVSRTIFCVPLVVAESLSEDARTSLMRTTFDEYSLAFEFPAAVSLADGKLTYSLKTPTWGRLYYAGFRKYLESRFDLAQSH